ncbi:unnamed protein product [Ilex paraguariensis]|uniref:RING-type E3 ubiquitin transferase n=1 Tax=Ilex paraguariensis TaxID=185542 RepID=A0ABC8RHL3_9AQUA
MVAKPAMMNLNRRLLVTEPGMPLRNGNKASESNFDTNLVIILAALLCALIFALGLNSIVRCALRCSHRFAMETPEQSAVCEATTGLKKHALRKIPTAIYGSGSNIPATECTICLGEFVDGERVRLLPNCNHGFHVRCIDQWLMSNSSCPNCRRPSLQLERSSPSSTAHEAARA